MRKSSKNNTPEAISDEKIRQVVESKHQWLYEKINHFQKYKDLPHPPGKELVNGESALYLGQQYRIEMVEKGLSEVQFTHHFLVPAKKEDAIRDWYIRKAKEKIVPRVRRQARELGVDVAMVKIVDNLYRWGSCTTKNNININWRLIKWPSREKRLQLKTV